MARRTFLLTLLTLPAGRTDRRLARAVVAVSLLVFAVVAPFARVKLHEIWAFIPSYESALALNDLITAVLLYSQYPAYRSRALLLLASAYLFTSLMAVVHALTFPGLFAPQGLLGSGPQTTAWLYMFWHAGFPVVVMAYALLKEPDGRLGAADRLATGEPPSGRWTIAWSIAAVGATVAGLALAATAGHGALPPIMQGNGYTPMLIWVVSSIWIFSLATLLVLWVRRPHSVLDLWLMIVLCAWLFDIALSAMLNGGRFDLGFYAGRFYGLLAASFVLIMLLIETATLHARQARLHAIERRHAADEVSSVNARLQTLLDSSPLPIFSLDSAGRVATWNRAAERVFGRTPAEMVGQTFASLPENAANAFDRVHTRVMAGEQLADLPLLWQRRDGKTVDIVHSGAPVREAGAQIGGAVYIAEDVTEKRKFERQLVQSQKIEAVGQLTGGIAHDFNNVLTVITGTIGLLEEGVADRPQLAEIAKLIEQAAERGANLTRQLLAFARKQPLQPQETDINVLMIEAAGLLRPTLGEQVEIESMLDDGAWPVLIDRNQLVTAIVNLAINARDAMPKGGKLTLESGNVVLDAAYAAGNLDVRPGPYVMIAVSDTGTGIPAAIRDRVFEPFFTTKEVGKGTGLGLSMVHGFVKQSGGHIKIYSEEGHGTTIKLYLPQAKEKSEPASNAIQPLPADTGNESILVVEDDRLVREYVVAQLRRLGYVVTAAATADEALAMIDAGPAPDLLFTDIIMPGGMNGRQLAKEALRRRPALKVLFTSGYTENAMIHQGRLDPGVLLLAKPYRTADLARMVRKALESSASLDRVA